MQKKQMMGDFKLREQQQQARERKEQVRSVVEQAKAVLHPLFGVPAPDLKVVLAPYDAQSDGSFDDKAMRVLFRGSDFYGTTPYDAHTVGEEVGHAFHFLMRPDVWELSRPDCGQKARWVADGSFVPNCERVCDAANLVELVGCYAGLVFVEQTKSVHDVKNYVNAEKVRWQDWKMSRFKARVRRHAKRFEQYGASLGVLTGDFFKELDARMEEKYLIHGAGYRAAFDLYGFPPFLRKKGFNIALLADTLTDYYREMNKLQRS